MLLLVKIKDAISKTNSLHQASRYLNCSYPTLKKYMLLYNMDLEKYKNPAGKGVRRNYSGKKRVDIEKILSGEIEYKNKQYLTWLLIREKIFEEKCYQCGFSKKRIFDQRSPLTLSFRDGNKNNLKLENLYLLCFNCFALSLDHRYIEKILKQDERHINSMKTVRKT